MNYYIYNFEKEFDFEKIIIGEKIIFNDNLSRYYIYYLDEIPKDLFIALPSIRIIYPYKNLKFNQINLPIYPLYDKTYNLISFLKKLQKYIIMKIKTDKIKKNIIEKKDNLKTLTINLLNDDKIIDEIKEFKINSELKGLLNIPYIWENENNIGLSLYASNFISVPKIESMNNNKEINLKNNIKLINLDTMPKPKTDNINFRISPNILNDAITKLNKV